MQKKSSKHFVLFSFFLFLFFFSHNNRSPRFCVPSRCGSLITTVCTAVVCKLFINYYYYYHIVTIFLSFSAKFYWFSFNLSRNLLSPFRIGIRILYTSICFYFTFHWFLWYFLPKFEFFLEEYWTRICILLSYNLMFTIPR